VTELIPSMSRRLAAEALGTAFLLATVIGSGIMAERLAGGNLALALPANTIATGAILAVLILVFAPLSGAHFNPAVTIALAWRAPGPRGWVAGYVACQIAGGITGVWMAHLMFELPVMQLAMKARKGIGQWLAEFVACFGLVLIIFGCARRGIAATAAAVGLYIVAAYWFTASTSFANPSVTISRALSDTFDGIAPAGVVPFVVAQLLGAAGAAALARWLWPADATAVANPRMQRAPPETGDAL
jgi:glycerol uptake facilitator-like aquaporin